MALSSLNFTVLERAVFFQVPDSKGCFRFLELWLVVVGALTVWERSFRVAEISTSADSGHLGNKHPSGHHHPLWFWNSGLGSCSDHLRISVWSGCEEATSALWIPLVVVV